MEEKLLKLVRNTLGCFIFISNELPPKMLNVFLHLLHQSLTKSITLNTIFTIMIERGNVNM